MSRASRSRPTPIPNGGVGSDVVISTSEARALLGAAARRRQAPPHRHLRRGRRLRRRRDQRSHRRRGRRADPSLPPRRELDRAGGGHPRSTSPTAFGPSPAASCSSLSPADADDPGKSTGARSATASSNGSATPRVRDVRFVHTRSADTVTIDLSTVASVHHDQWLEREIAPRDQGRTLAQGARAHARSLAEQHPGARGLDLQERRQGHSRGRSRHRRLPQGRRQGNSLVWTFARADRRPLQRDRRRPGRRRGAQDAHRGARSQACSAFPSSRPR